MTDWGTKGRQTSRGPGQGRPETGRTPRTTSAGLFNSRQPSRNHLLSPSFQRRLSPLSSPPLSSPPLPPTQHSTLNTHTQKEKKKRKKSAPKVLKNLHKTPVHNRVVSGPAVNEVRRVGGEREREKRRLAARLKDKKNSRGP